MGNILNSLIPLPLVITGARIEAYNENKDEIKDVIGDFVEDYKESNDENGIFKYSVFSPFTSAFKAFQNNKDEIADKTKNVISDVGKNLKDWWMDSTIAGNVISHFSGEG